MTVNSNDLFGGATHQRAKTCARSQPVRAGTRSLRVRGVPPVDRGRPAGLARRGAPIALGRAPDLDAQPAEGLAFARLGSKTWLSTAETPPFGDAWRKSSGNSHCVKVAATSERSRHRGPRTRRAPRRFGRSRAGRWRGPSRTRRKRTGVQTPRHRAEAVRPGRRRAGTIGRAQVPARAPASGWTRSSAGSLTGAGRPWCSPRSACRTCGRRPGRRSAVARGRRRSSASRAPRRSCPAAAGCSA